MSTPRKIRCIVEQVANHGDRVYTVALKPERAVPAFLPGQFLHLTLDEYDPSGFWPESRVFSIASSPADRSALTLIYSVKGKYTARMEAELCVGKSVWVKLPYGEFVVDGGTDAVLIAGGTRITAFQAFIEGLTPQHPNKVVLLYGARRPGLLLGREKIEEQAGNVPAFQAHYFSETQPECVSPRFGVRRLDAAFQEPGLTGSVPCGLLSPFNPARQAAQEQSGVKPPHSKLDSTAERNCGNLGKA